MGHGGEIARFGDHKLVTCQIRMPVRTQEKDLTEDKTVIEDKSWIKIKKTS